jgi:ribonucleoside-diphosphate reductase alpha chain
MVTFLRLISIGDNASLIA